MYVYDAPNGTATVEKANDTIAYNWMLANYVRMVLFVAVMRGKTARIQ